MMGIQAPHPIPYQGSKRNIAPQIIRFFPESIECFIEPFAGSAAMSLATGARNRAKKFWLNDLNKPLMDLWKQIINNPEDISRKYEYYWHEQQDDPRSYYDRIRDEFNQTGRPDCFLYLLARCVKASVRYNTSGEFNQSPDNRRLGANPETMKNMITGASYLLKNKTKITSMNYQEVLEKAKPLDIVYMDPPYQGVCRDRDNRYLNGIQFSEFVESLSLLNENRIRYIVSYDGRTGKKIHGKLLPQNLDLTHIEIKAGRSTQSTLLGKKDITFESLYLSPALTEQLPEELLENKQIEQMSLL